MAGLLDLLFSGQPFAQAQVPLAGTPWQVPQGSDPVPPRPMPQDLPPLPAPVEVPGRKVAAPVADQPMMPPMAQSAQGPMPEQAQAGLLAGMLGGGQRIDPLGSLTKGTPFQPVSDWIGQNRGALLALAAGMAGAPSLGEGMSRGFRNAAAGAQMDQQNAKQAQGQQQQNATARFLMSKGMSPDQVMAMLSNPGALNDYLKASVVAPEKSSYGVIGKDQFGNEQYGWINAGAQTITPAAGAVTGAGGSAGMNIPPGMDPKVYRAEMTKAAVEQQAGASTAANTAQSGQQYIQRAYDLYDKLGKANAIGPISASGPNRMLTGMFGGGNEALRQEYEAVQKQLELLQAQINMKGQGQITESERKILGLTLPRLDAADPQTGLNILKNLNADFNVALQRAGRPPVTLIPSQGAGPSEGQMAPTGGGLQPGAVVNGFVYRGGNPNDQNSWGRAQ